MKRIVVGHCTNPSKILPTLISMTMDKRCHKTMLRKLHKNQDFGKRIKLWNYYFKRRIRKEETK
jgi:hypothetical protein